MRYLNLDITRGVAIVGMILFHIFYALLYIFDVKSLASFEPMMQVFGKIGAVLFILIAGVSFALAEKKYGDRVVLRYLPKIGTLALYASLITLGTHFFMYSQRIYFGILHFFTLSFILLLFVRKLRYFTLVLVGGIGASFLSFPIESQSVWAIPFGSIPSWFFSADFYPLVPYFAALLVGYVFGLLLIDTDKLTLLTLKRENVFSRGLSFLGKHSLFIYLIHMPIVVAILWCIFFLIR